MERLCSTEATLRSFERLLDNEPAQRVFRQENRCFPQSGMRPIPSSQMLKQVKICEGMIISPAQFRGRPRLAKRCPNVPEQYESDIASTFAGTPDNRDATP